MDRYLADREPRLLPFGEVLVKERWLPKCGLFLLLLQISLAVLRLSTGDHWGAVSHILLCYCGYLACQDRLSHMALALYCLGSVVAVCELLFLVAHLKKIAAPAKSLKDAPTLMPDPHPRGSWSATATDIESEKIASVSHKSNLIVLFLSPLTDMLSAVLMFKLYRSCEEVEFDGEASANLVPVPAEPSGLQLPHPVVPPDFRGSLDVDIVSPLVIRHRAQDCRPSFTVAAPETTGSTAAHSEDHVVDLLSRSEGRINGVTEEHAPTGTHAVEAAFRGIYGQDSVAAIDNSERQSWTNLSGSLVSVFQEPDSVSQFLSRRLASDAYYPFQGGGVKLSSVADSSGVSTPKDDRDCRKKCRVFFPERRCTPNTLKW